MQILNITKGNIKKKGGFTMSGKDKKAILFFIDSKTKEMLRYFSYKTNKSMNSLVGEILYSYLEKELSTDKYFKEIANI